MTRSETFRGPRRFFRGSRPAAGASKVRLLLEILEVRLPPGDAVFAGLLARELIPVAERATEPGTVVPSGLARCLPPPALFDLEMPTDVSGSIWEGRVRGHAAKWPGPLAELEVLGEKPVALQEAQLGHADRDMNPHPSAGFPDRFSVSANPGAFTSEGASGVPGLGDLGVLTQPRSLAASVGAAPLQEAQGQLLAASGSNWGRSHSGLVYSTYLGGRGTEEFTDVAVDRKGYVYVTGITTTPDFPVTEGAFQPGYGGGRADAFVAKLSRDGSELVYATYLGGSGFDLGQAITVDDDGNAYVTGMTASTDFPTTAGAFQPGFGGGTYDAFVVKLDPDGAALAYSTYLGGTGDEGHTVIPVLPTTPRSFGLAVDAAGNAYVRSITNSTDFPTTPGVLQPSYRGGATDNFVTKLNTSGSALLYSTYLGGTGFEFGNGLAVDAEGNAHLTGRTDSPDFPTRDAVQPDLGGGVEDAFVTKLNADATALVYSTYLGGSDVERGFGIKVDPQGNAWVVGTTQSVDFPTANALQPAHGGGVDLFVTKLTPNGSFLSSTFLGRTGNDLALSVDLDAAGNPSIVGRTNSTDFPLVNPIQPTYGGNTDALMVKLNASGSALLFSTYLGGSAEDFGRGIAVDRKGDAYVTGWTLSTDFPTVNPLQPESAGLHDGYVTKIRARR